ncbi:hypothetical protein HQ571_01890 [Candidatus Kuenenbacteria bacterium]|nr:hypothetical protein [Candidatus Kuenenbacteria bacterium]
MLEVIIFLFIFVGTYLAIFFRPFKLKESYYVLTGIILMLLWGILQLTDIVNAIVSFDAVEPYAILIFFTAFAVLSAGLDELGFFEYWSIRVVQAAKHDGLKLYKYLFVLSALTSYIAANDIVILTLTPFVLYFAKYTKIKARGYLLTMFIVANTASIGQITSNPTNFIVSMVYKIPFFENLLIMFLPTLLGLIAIYFILKKVFYREFKIKFNEKKVDLNKIIKNKYQCRVFYIMLLLLMLLFAVAPILKLQLWVIAVIGTLLAILISGINPLKLFKHLPWNVILLVTGLFVIVYGFIATGIFSWLGLYVQELVLTGSYFTFVSLSVFVTFFAGIFNNIPVTTILASLSLSITSVRQEIVSYALIIGSNVGANFTILGSLAGIMWFHLIKKKKHHIKLLDFTKFGLLASIPFIIIVTFVLYIEFWLFF